MRGVILSGHMPLPYNRYILTYKIYFTTTMVFLFFWPLESIPWGPLREFARSAKLSFVPTFFIRCHLFVCSFQSSISLCFFSPNVFPPAQFWPSNFRTPVRLSLRQRRGPLGASLRPSTPRVSTGPRWRPRGAPPSRARAQGGYATAAR